MSSSQPTALIAEDEPLLAAAPQAELARAWPALQIVAVVGDGASAVAQAFEAQAVNYLLKPVQAQRLQKNSIKNAASPCWPFTSSY